MICLNINFFDNHIFFEKITFFVYKYVDVLYILCSCTIKQNRKLYIPLFVDNETFVCRRTQ